MSENVCMPKSYFLIIFFIFSIFYYFHTIRMNNYILKLEANTKPTIIRPNIIIKNEKKETVTQDIILDRDEKAVYNDFKPPERRLNRHNYPTESVKNLINFPTRGHPDNYQNLGIMVRKNDERILKLFGRQKFPGSSQYEYYVVDSFNLQKYPLKLNGMKEISDKDVISIPWLDQGKGKFEVQIFDYDVPRYNPNIY